MSKTSPKTKKKFKIRYIILLILLALIIFGLFEFKIVRIPRCDPAPQGEVDWPPEEPGLYEETTHNQLRILEPPVFQPPQNVGLCNVSGADAAQGVAIIPLEPRFLLYQPDLTDVSVAMYHSVEVAETFECIAANRGNLVEGLLVEPHPDNPQMVYVSPPGPLEAGQVYMLTFGTDPYNGVVARAGAVE